MLRKMFVLLMILLMAAGSAAALPVNREEKNEIAPTVHRIEVNISAKDDDRHIPEQ